MTTGSQAAKPANASEVTTDSSDSSAPEGSASPTTSTSEPYRELIEVGLSHGRNAMSMWQQLVDQHGFTGAYESVKRFVRKLRGTQSPEVRAIIQTAVGEDYGKSRVMVRSGAVATFLAEISAASVT